MFSSNQKKVFMELNGEILKENVIPNGDESRKFWRGIWDNSMKHNDKAEWRREVEIELGGVNKQDNMKITVDGVREQLRKTPNWKAPGSDEVHGYWLKNMSSLHEKIAKCSGRKWEYPNMDDI